MRKPSIISFFLNKAKLNNSKKMIVDKLITVPHSVFLIKPMMFLASFLCSCCLFIFFLLKNSPQGDEAYSCSVTAMASVSF